VTEPVEVPAQPPEAVPEPEPETPAEAPDEAEEAEEPEQPDEAPDEPEAPGQEQPQALSQKEVEARMKRLDKSAGVWRERVATIMEADAEILLPCPLCEPIIPGFVMPTPATPERFPAVREFMGDAQPRELRHDPDTHTCEVCDGEGVLDTGSHVDNQRELVCGYCGGRGWLGQRRSTSPAAVPAPSPDANGVQTGPLAPPPVDDPEVAALRAKGYVIIEPVKT
jgi:hypothetical protein